MVTAKIATLTFRIEPELQERRCARLRNESIVPSPTWWWC